MSVAISAINLNEQEKWVSFQMNVLLGELIGDADKAVVFRFDWDGQASVANPVQALSEKGLQGTWGNPIWHDASGEYILTVPAFSPYSSSKGQGLVVFWEPRVGFTYTISPSKQELGRRFYLPAQKDFEESGFDIGDGDGKVPYMFYLGYSPQTSWQKVYWDYYVSENFVRVGIRRHVR